MTEFIKLKEPANAGGLRHLMAEVERITDNWERIANRPFDEEAKMGKLRELIPATTWSYIAQGARNARTYRELVSIVMNQLTDPKTGMLIGEKTPSLNDLSADPGTYAVGKGGFGGVCWNCGEKGHRSRDCREPRKAGKGNGGPGEEPTALGALNYKGKGKGAYGKGVKGSMQWQG